MIARIWHGRTKKTDADIYRKYTESTGIKNLISTKGNRGAQIWQRDEGDITHIWVVSWWPDIEAIKAFAGEDTDRAKYYDEDRKYLLEMEPYVQHCNCITYQA